MDKCNKINIFLLFYCNYDNQRTNASWKLQLFLFLVFSELVQIYLVHICIMKIEYTVCKSECSADDRVVSWTAAKYMHIKPLTINNLFLFVRKDFASLRILSIFHL